MSQEFITREEYNARHSELLQRITDLHQGFHADITATMTLVNTLRESVDKDRLETATQKGVWEGSQKQANRLIPLMTGIIGVLSTAVLFLAMHA